MPSFRFIGAAMSVLIPVLVISSAAVGQSHSKYAGQEKRSIKSLSAKDIEELQRGGGWGLAKTAELNGVPGPAHLLEMKVQIGLTSAQITQITAIYGSMRARAEALGRKFIEIERELDGRFRDGSITSKSLSDLLKRSSDVRMRLRETHLAAHLEVRPLLSDKQVSQYNRLRGYGQSDPCAAAPKGHDLAMWRKHNGCD
jgi:hypothetical protein